MLLEEYVLHCSHLCLLNLCLPSPQLLLSLLQLLLPCVQLAGHQLQARLCLLQLLLLEPHLVLVLRRLCSCRKECTSVWAVLKTCAAQEPHLPMRPWATRLLFMGPDPALQVGLSLCHC